MIHFVIALHAEAKPIIDAFHLQKRHDCSSYDVYATDSINLIISGIGKLSAAIATAYLRGVNLGTPSPVWLNIGIAGSLNHELGHGLIAHRITDDATGIDYYPGFCFETCSDTSDVLTVSEPVSTYVDGKIYDMEAAGYYLAASKFSSPELIHSYKIISDNKSSSSQAVSGRLATDLISSKMDSINTLVEQLRNIENTVAVMQQDSPGFTDIVEQWHFTVSQRHQLRNLLRRWHAITNININDLDLPYSCHSSKDVLKRLDKELSTIPVSFHK